MSNNYISNNGKHNDVLRMNGYIQYVDIADEYGSILVHFIANRTIDL